MTLAPPATPATFCLCHARPAVDAGLALDGVHRVAFHPHRGGAPEPVQSRRVLGTWDQDEALTLVQAKRRARALAAHGNHRSASGISRDCELCLARGAHLDHVEDRRLEAGCVECDRAQVRAWSSKVGR